MNPRNRRFRDDTTVQICGPQAQQPGAWRPHISQQQQQQAQNYARQRHREPWNRQHYHRNNRSNWGFNNNNRQAGTTSRHADDTRPRKHFQQSNNGIRPSDSTGDCESEFPDYTYDPVTKKYFKILPDSAGVHGYMRSEVAAKRNRDRLNTIAAHRPRVASGSFALRPVIQPVSKILSNAQIGLKSAIRPDIRYFESRLLNVSDKPSSTHDIDLSLSVSDRAFGCQFLDVSRDGRKLFGCWAVGDTSSNAQRNASRITCLDVEIDQRIIVKSALAAEDDPALEHIPRNYMGLKFTPTDFAWDVSDPNLVDMVTAQVDSDVTCVLYATATTLMTSRGLQNCCKVFLRPIPELCTVDDIDILSSPIYNMHWSSSDCVWSCGWNANKMRVGLGLEKAVKVIDVLANKNLYVSTNRKLVLSQEFEQQGNLVYLGLQAEDASCVDLRSNEISSRIRRARNVDFIKLLKDRDNQMVTDNFQGQLRVWDIRRLDRELFSLSGHSNSHYRLPVFVDPDEKAVFAVGQDGTTRGWSLRSGDLLCAVPCPRPVEARTDFPRVAFSDTWGGRAGNGALVLAVENSLRVHELNL